MSTNIIKLKKNAAVQSQNKSFIQGEIESDDPFVRVLYKNLEDRIQLYESEGSGIERLKFSDLKTELIIALMITGFLISVIL